MFGCMEIAESIYEVVVEPAYKKPAWEDSNRAGHGSKMIVEAALSNTESKMSESNGRCRKIFRSY